MPVDVVTRDMAGREAGDPVARKTDVRQRAVVQTLEGFDNHLALVPAAIEGPQAADTARNRDDQVGDVGADARGAVMAGGHFHVEGREGGGDAGRVDAGHRRASLFGRRAADRPVAL
jgi:hypothetical protein